MSIYVLPTQPKKSPQIGSIVMDAFITEEHVFNSDVAEHPTEKGYPISDNVVQKPIELTLEVVVSPSPIQTTLPEPLSRADDKYKQLRYLQRNGLRVSVVTGLVRYTNMLITNVTVPRSKETSQVLKFTITMKQVRLSSTSTLTTETFEQGSGIVGSTFDQELLITGKDEAFYQPNGIFGGSTGSGTRVNKNELITTHQSVERNGNFVTRLLENIRGEEPYPY